MRGSTITRRPTSILALPARRTCQSRCGLNNSSHTTQQTKTTACVSACRNQSTLRSQSQIQTALLPDSPLPAALQQKTTQLYLMSAYVCMSHNTACKSHTVTGRRRQHPISATLNLSFNDTPIYPEWTCATSRGLNRPVTLLLSPCRMCFYRELYSSQLFTLHHFRNSSCPQAETAVCGQCSE